MLTERPAASDGGAPIGAPRGGSPDGGQSGGSPDGGQSTAVSVSQAMNVAKGALEKIRMSVVGEVSEVSDKPGWKAVYFTIRDEGAVMPCIMWRSQYDHSGLALEVGMLVEVSGKFTCYVAKGRLQFSVSRVSPVGEGTLRLQVARLARKLEAEGLMDSARKRRPPALPTRIAVVTSPRGKAVHDVIRTLRRRYPLGELLVCGVPVEGVGAPAHLIRGLETAAYGEPAPDVILLVRGGGSYEDLMPFNDESLARAIAACPVPIVTGIGHEPDNSIADMVADVRCSTPTAAAEAVAPSVAELSGKVSNATAALAKAIETRLDAATWSLVRLAERPPFTDEHRLTAEATQELESLGERLLRAIPEALAADAAHLSDLRGRLSRALPAQVAGRAGELRLVGSRLSPAVASVLERRRSEIALAAGKLEALSPLATLARGYSIAYAADGRTVVTGVAGVGVGDGVTVRLADGSLACTVDSIRREDAS